MTTGAAMALLGYILLIAFAALTWAMAGRRPAAARARPLVLERGFDADPLAGLRLEAAVQRRLGDLPRWGSAAWGLKYDRVMLASFVAVMDLSMLQPGPHGALTPEVGAIDLGGVPSPADEAPDWRDQLVVGGGFAHHIEPVDAAAPVLGWEPAHLAALDLRHDQGWFV